MLKFIDRISRKNSHDMIIMMARYGNHSEKVIFRTDADIKRFYANQGGNFDEIVEYCRNFRNQIYYFENIIGSTWQMSGGKVTLFDKQTGEEKLVVKGPGVYSTSTYWSHFENAANSWIKSVENNSYAEFLSSITEGIASLEAYLNHRADIWNNDNSDDKLEDNRNKKISFDDKIDLWIPKILKGKKLDKSIRNWSDFMKLRKTRNNLAIHPKNRAYGISLAEFVNQINIFRTGIAGLIIQLHVLFLERIPSIIIRAYFSPEVEIIKEEIE